MNRAAFLSLVVALSLIAPLGGAVSLQQGPTHLADATSSVQEPTEARWNVTVTRSDTLSNVVGSTDRVTFVYGKALGKTPGLSPAIRIIANDNTSNVLATEVVSDSSWSEESWRKIDGRVVGDTVVVRYGSTVSAVTHRNGEWTEVDLGKLNAAYETMFSSEEAVFVATRAGIRKYSAGDDPREVARYDTKYELETASYAGESVTFRTMDASCSAGGGGGCKQQIDAGTRYGSLDTDLNPRWTQFRQGKYAYTHRAGGVLITNVGLDDEFVARSVKTGDQMWTWNAPRSGYIADTVQGDVHFWGVDSRAFVVDSETGGQRWSYDRSNIAYESASRLLMYANGEYSLRNRSTGELLARHKGPEPGPDPEITVPNWDSVSVFDGGAYISFTVEPGPDRIILNTTTGETVTRFDPPERIDEAYETLTNRGVNSNYLERTTGSMGPDGSFYIRALVRGYEVGEYNSLVFARPSNRSWVTLDTATVSAGGSMMVPPVVQVDDVLLYVKTGDSSDGTLVGGHETIRVRSFDGSYLGGANLYRTDLEKLVANSKEQPYRNQESIQNENLTVENYKVRMSTGGDGREILFIEPRGHEDPYRNVVRLSVVSAFKNYDHTTISLACAGSTLSADVRNPASVPVELSVSGADKSITVQPGESKSFSLPSTGNYTFDAETAAGGPVDEELEVTDEVSVGDGNIIVPNCTPSGGDAERGSAGQSPGFTPLIAVVVIVFTLGARHHLQNRP